MINAIIKSQTRRKLLIKFFVNIANTGYLNQLAEEFSESTNSVRKELNNLTEANFLKKEFFKNKVIYSANTNHPLFNEIQNIVKKYLGIEKMVQTVLDKMGNVNEIFLLGDFASGIDSDQIDVLITGSKLNTDYIGELEIKLSSLLKKKVVIVGSSSSNIRINKLLVFSN
tara:strand:+ start:3754 stop:4263 length:510 start_codon:yes stop_codon:yes gene_type:complete